MYVKTALWHRSKRRGRGEGGVWGTVEQLLINKSILEEVRLMRRNLATVWLD